MLSILIFVSSLGSPGQLGAADSGAIPPFALSQKANLKGNYASIYAPVPFSGGFVCGTLAGTLVHVKNGIVVKSFEIDGSDIVSSPAIDLANAFIGTKAGTFAKVDLQTGEIIWRFKANNAVYGMPILDGGKVFFGSADENFYCLDTDSGKLLFKFKISAPIWSTPLVVGDKVIFDSDDNKVHCLDKTTGKELWSFAGQGWFEAKPVLYADNVITCSLDKNVYCLKAADGELVWKYQGGGPFRSGGVLVGSNFVVADDDGTVYSIGTGYGIEKWKMPGFGPISWPLATDGKRVFFVDERKDFTGLDDNGNIIWKRRLGHAVRSEVYIGAGNIFFATTDGYLDRYDECAYMEILPANRNLGQMNAKGPALTVPLIIKTGRADGRARYTLLSRTPYEAGKRCKSVEVRSTRTHSDGTRMAHQYNMIIKAWDSSFCNGENDFNIVVEPGCPFFIGGGVYEEPSMGGYVMVKFTVDVVNQPNGCETCEPCFDVVIKPDGAPYFKRSEKAEMTIEVPSTDGIDRGIFMTLGKTDWFKGDTVTLIQEGGIATHKFSIDCMDLPGGSEFAIPFSISCHTCEDRDGSNVTWESEQKIEFFTDPRLRIEMEPGKAGVKVNDAPAQLDVPAEVVDGRTLVPIRFIAETFGSKVDWEPSTRTITITRKNKVLKYFAYKDKAEFNGVEVTIDVGPIIRSGRTLVPLRSVAESLGAKVRWVAQTKSIIIDWEF